MGETFVFEIIELEAVFWGRLPCPHGAYLGLVRKTEATSWNKAEASRDDR